MSVSAPALAEAALQIVGAEHVSLDVSLSDASGLTGTAGVLAHPASPQEVRELVAWAYTHNFAIVPVGGATGYSGGIVPQAADAASTLAIALDRLNRVRSFDPLLWRIEVEAGVTTATVARLARENGLLFPPDPGAAEQSQIGGNLATNAGGPHAFKYGVTSRWVTGVEAVVAPGELVSFGGPVRKDVAGYDLKSLLIGSEGTLGIITAAWLRLTPAPAQTIPVVAAFDSIAAGVDGIYAALASGVVPATVEYVQGSALQHAPAPFLDGRTAEFLVICEAESEHERDELLAALGESAFSAEPRVVWRWRNGVSLAVRGARGEKLAEDIAVPLDRLAEGIQRTLEIGAAHDLEATSWGHAFLFDPSDAGERARAEAAAQDLFELACELGGSVSGEHGAGKLKAGQLLGQWSDAAVGVHETIKRALDPKGLLNPGTKDPRPSHLS